MIREDMIKYYPDLTSMCKVTIIEMLPKLLPMFGSQASEFTMKNFAKIGIDCLMEHRVTKIANNVKESNVGSPSLVKAVTVLDKHNTTKDIPCGLVIWASGVGQVDFAKKMIDNIPDQKGNRWVRVIFYQNRGS